jgi:4-amino-4-deoxy-L-arabinose transferase-like glycosyltransferase
MRAVVPLVAALVAVVLLSTASGGSLYDGDEAVYGQMAREMRETGDLLTLRWDGQPAHQRPPAYVWMLATAAGILGEGEGPLRLPSALATALTVLGVALVARRVSGSHAVAAAASVVYACLSMTWRYAQAVESDPLLACVCVFAVERFLAAMEPALGDDVRKRRLWVFGALVGFACLVKQGVGLLPLAAPLVWSVSRPGKNDQVVWRKVALPALIVWAPWHIGMLMHHGPSFLASYVGENVIARATSSVFAPTSPLFYGQVLARREGPVLASLLGLALVVALVRAVRTRHAPSLVACAVPLVALSALTVAQTRIEYYLVIATPFLAVCAALVARKPSSACAVGILVFLAGPIVHGWPILGPKDPSHDVRALAEKAHRDSHGQGRLVVVGTQTSAPRYYARMPTARLTTDHATYQRLQTLARFGLPGTVAKTSPAAVCESPFVRDATYLLVKDGPDGDTVRKAGCVAEIAREGTFALMRHPKANF